jgi:hypothetical protein
MKVLKEEKLPVLEPLKVVSFKTPNNQIVIVALNHDPTHVQSVQIHDPNHGYLALTLLPESVQTVVYDIAMTV